MSDEERLKWLKEIEKDIFVCSLESTFVEDAKSCAIHSAIEALENQADIISRIEAEKNKLNEEGELHYSKSEIAIFDKCLEFLKGEE